MRGTIIRAGVLVLCALATIGCDSEGGGPADEVTEELSPSVTATPAPATPVPIPQVDEPPVEQVPRSVRQQDASGLVELATLVEVDCAGSDPVHPDGWERACQTGGDPTGVVRILPATICDADPVLERNLREGFAERFLSGVDGESLYVVYRLPRAGELPHIPAGSFRALWTSGAYLDIAPGASIVVAGFGCGSPQEVARSVPPDTEVIVGPRDGVIDD